MVNSSLYKNYKNALKQKYNAVCFDIDGTLTEDESKKIGEKAVKIIYKLLTKKVPVVFITGRGEIGLNDLIDDIISKLKNEYKLSFLDLNNLYALTNDGARLFKTDINSENIFDKNEYISSKESFEELNDCNNVLQKRANKFELDKYFKITCSKDLITNEIINIRIVIKKEWENRSDALFESISNMLINYKNLNVSLGIYENNKIIQIGTAKKSEAIKKAEKLIGIPEDSMLRIGDCGDLKGNDFSMLDCPQGFSVNKVSGKEDRCFPIIKDDGTVIKGIDGTEFLINNAKILTTLCLEKPDKCSYTKIFADIERKIVKGKSDLISEFNNKINNNFNLNYGINDLFDEGIGSIKIPMYEWELINNDNPLKKLWLFRKKNNLQYCLRDNDAYLLRGSSTYYHFLSKRKNIWNEDEKKKVDITEFEDVVDWFDNYFDFILKSLDAVEENNDFDDIYNKKMILGIIDNIRNYYLININYDIKKLSEEKTLLINLENPNNEIIKEKYSNLLKVDGFIEKTCLGEISKLPKKEILEILKNALNIISHDKFNFERTSRKANYSKDFRAYREIDNFIQNYINSILSKNKIKENMNDVSFCGLCYGGLELPIIFKLLFSENKNINILSFNKNVSGYSKKQSSTLRTFNINDSGGINLVGIDTNKKTILMDDNILTGKSIQLTSNIMCDLGIDIEKVSIVKYPSINRLEQMFLPNHGAVNYKHFFNYVVGLTFPSPYSWRDNNSKDIYEDSLGVFDLNRRKIIECLIKNGDYSKRSEAAEYMKSKNR